MAPKNFKITFEDNKVTSCTPTRKKIAMRGMEDEEKWCVSGGNGFVTMYLRPDSPDDVLQEAKDLYKQNKQLHSKSKTAKNKLRAQVNLKPLN